MRQDVLGMTVAATERAVLGGMMLDKRVVFQVADEVEAGDFADGRLGDLFRVIVQLAEEGKPTDPLAVTDRLMEQGDLARVCGAEGPAMLHAMTSDVPSAAAAAFYAGRVKRSAVKRRIVAAGTKLVQLGQSEEGDAYEQAEAARDEVERLSGAAKVEVVPVGDSVPALMQSLREVPRFAPTPWEGVNGLINGFRPGALYVIGARPGSGKTIMGLQAAAHLAERGPVAFSSLEMDTVDLTRRLYALNSSVNLTSLTRNVLSPAEWLRLEHATPRIQRMPLFIDDKAAVTVAHVRAFARSVKRRRGSLHAVVVDYLQLMRPTDPRKPRWEAVGEMTAALKQMARELEVPVIALCQLNRGTESQGLVRRLPTLGDLRESGSIEQDADVVLLLQRGHDENADAPTEDLHVVVAKNRHGRAGQTDLIWEGQFARVQDRPW